MHVHVLYSEKYSLTSTFIWIKRDTETDRETDRQKESEKEIVLLDFSLLYFISPDITYTCINRDIGRDRERETDRQTEKDKESLFSFFFYFLFRDHIYDVLRERKRERPLFFLYYLIKLQIIYENACQYIHIRLIKVQNFNSIFKNDRYNHIYDYSFIYFYHYNMKGMERRKRKKMLIDVLCVFIFWLN